MLTEDIANLHFQRVASHPIYPQLMEAVVLPRTASPVLAARSTVNVVQQMAGAGLLLITVRLDGK
jgi:hypothetical protein